MFSLRLHTTKHRTTYTKHIPPTRCPRFSPESYSFWLAAIRGSYPHPVGIRWWRLLSNCLPALQCYAEPTVKIKLKRDTITRTQNEFGPSVGGSKREGAMYYVGVAWKSHTAAKQQQQKRQQECQHYCSVRGRAGILNVLATRAMLRGYTFFGM